MYDSSPDVLARGGGLAEIICRPATFEQIFRIYTTDDAAGSGSISSQSLPASAAADRR
jgi:hypothetical protein